MAIKWIGQFDRALKQLGLEYIRLVNDMFTKLGVIQGATQNIIKVNNFKLRMWYYILLNLDQNWKQFLYDCNTNN